MNKIVFVDTETTGLNSHRHHVWEVAAIVRRPGMPDVEYLWQIRPDLTTANAKALEVGRYEERFRVADDWDACALSPTRGTRFNLDLDEALADIRDTLDGAVLVANNAAFDDRHLAALLRRTNLERSWHYRPVCVVAMAAGRLHATQPSHQALARPWRAVELGEALGVPAPTPEAAHTALGDARWVRAMWDAITTGGAA